LPQAVFPSPSGAEAAKRQQQSKSYEAQTNTNVGYIVGI